MEIISEIRYTLGWDVRKSPDALSYHQNTQKFSNLEVIKKCIRKLKYMVTHFLLKCAHCRE